MEPLSNYKLLRSAETQSPAATMTTTTTTTRTSRSTKWSHFASSTRNGVVSVSRVYSRGSVRTPSCRYIGVRAGVEWKQERERERERRTEGVAEGEVPRA